ncbi:MAG: hypothetical protein AAFV43_09385 [Planctomycetota bacterium]
MPLLANNAPAANLSGLEAIQAADGWAIAITGTVIVFSALAAISLFIGVLPRLLAACGPWLPEIGSHHDAPVSAASTGPPDDRAKRAAAAAWAKHHDGGG